jgi:phosphatidylserine/phosphatidylglycerophosphate/cardiolipin synthase-like enzyme
MKVRVYANSDDTFVVWKTEGSIPGCRGFAIYRKVDGSKAEPVTNYVGWGEEGVDGPRPSTEWPIQRYMWCDYKARSGQRVSYRVVPMVGPDREHLAPSEGLASAWTDELTLRPDGTGGVAAYFNRGIVASQWLSRVLGPGKPGARQKKLAEIIEDPSDKTRAFLGGELRAAMLRLLAEAKAKGVDIYAALYELDDPELIDALVEMGDKANVILANGSTKKKNVDPNRAARRALEKAGVAVHKRMTAPRHLAHNKFVVFCDAKGEPSSVWTGSTNWSRTGLCTQANNGIHLANRELAAVYKTQWDQLLEAGSKFDRTALAETNSKSVAIGKPPKTVKVWFTPVDEEADLDEVRDLIAKAKDGILFVMFNPGPAGTLLNAIIDRQEDANIVVRGVVNQDPSSSKNPVLIFRRKEILKGSFQVALPAAIDERVTYWIPELKKKQGAWAMVHSKTIVIDPFGASPVVVTGSHNLGPKASRANDDNLVIIKGDRDLAATYAVNIEAIFASYRWRYNRIYNKQARAFTALEDSDEWQVGHLRGAELQELDFWLGP